MKLKRGTKIATISHSDVPSETGIICALRAENKPMPGPDWHIVKFDADGAKLCVHESNFAIAS